MWFDVYIHSALPLIVSGLRTGIAVAYILLYVSETLGASYGVGYRLSVSYDVFRTAKMMACLITLGVMGALSDQLFAWGTRAFAPWMEAERTLV
jgi:ABC-type nitrate/sulfonate/bicarbonate transport system permease component